MTHHDDNSLMKKLFEHLQTNGLTELNELPLILLNNAMKVE